MTIQQRIDSELILQRYRDGNWRESSAEELIGDYPFLQRYIQRIDRDNTNSRVAILKSLNENKYYMLYLFSRMNEYSIWVTPKSIGAGASIRYCEPFEDWHRGHDLPDGKCEEETFVQILFAILHNELIPYDDGRPKPVIEQEVTV